MNKRFWIWPVFALAVVAQLSVPASMILSHERTLREGDVFKFKTRPVDPADAFRGRYVWLSLEPRTVQVPHANQWQRRQKAYAVLGTDSNGFVMVKRLEHTRPTDESAVQVLTRWADVKKGKVHIQWKGLERYYMTESKAPAAETAYLKHSVKTNQSCHVTVRVRGTHAVVENLFIGDRPILAWLSEHQDE